MGSGSAAFTGGTADHTSIGQIAAWVAVASTMMLALALIEPTAVVRGPMKVPVEGIYAAAPLVVVLLLFTLWVVWRRRRVRASSRRRGGIMASFALSVALGNALVDLGSFFDASRPVAMAMEPGDCDRIPDAQGDGREPPSRLGPKPHGPAEPDQPENTRNWV